MISVRCYTADKHSRTLPITDTLEKCVFGHLQLVCQEPVGSDIWWCVTTYPVKIM